MVQEWSPVKRVLSACEKTPRRQKSSDFYLDKTDLFLGCAALPLPGAADRTDFTLDYLLQLAIICFYSSMKKGFAFVLLLCYEACPGDCTLYSCDSSEPSNKDGDCKRL